MEYRRVYVHGGTYFFTLVTHQRKMIFSDPNAILTLSDAFEYVKTRHPFTVVAHVIMPDHLHTIWTMPDDDADFSIRWRLIKSCFTRKFTNSDFREPFWQNRFWEHLIRDERDFSAHIDYIHYNPVKHEYTSSPSEWPYSSFIKFVKNGFYPDNWCEDVKVYEDKYFLE